MGVLGTCDFTLFPTCCLPVLLILGLSCALLGNLSNQILFAVDPLGHACFHLQIESSVC